MHARPGGRGKDVETVDFPCCTSLTIKPVIRLKNKNGFKSIPVCSLNRLKRAQNRLKSFILIGFFPPHIPRKTVQQH